MQLALQGTGRRQIEAVEIVQRTIEQSGQTTARHTDALVGFDRLDSGLGQPVAVGHLAGQCRFREGRIDHAILGQQAKVAVGKAGQFIMALGQIMGRAALGNHQ
ncbi:hypothetical protein D3C84_632590 [compost metagenome]